MGTRMDLMRHDPWYSVIAKWAIPMLFAMFGFYVQSVGLHWATYCYVQRIMRMDPTKRNMTTFAVLDDPVAAWMAGEDNSVNSEAGRTDTNSYLNLLDGVSFLFPAVFIG